jgi:hypothetical protein
LIAGGTSGFLEINLICSRRHCPYSVSGIHVSAAYANLELGSLGKERRELECDEDDRLEVVLVLVNRLLVALLGPTSGPRRVFHRLI